MAERNVFGYDVFRKKKLQLAKGCELREVKDELLRIQQYLFSVESGLSDVEQALEEIRKKMAEYPGAESSSFANQKTLNDWRGIVQATGFILEKLSGELFGRSGVRDW